MEEIMVEYIVTLEIYTSKWKMFLRFFRLIDKRDEFTLSLSEDFFQKGDVISSDLFHDFLILKRK